MVLDADVVEHASGPPHGVDGDGGHDRSANKKQDATGLVGGSSTNTPHPIGMADTTVAVSADRLSHRVPVTAVNVGQTSPSAGARGPKGNCPQEAAPQAIFVGIVNL